MKKVWKKLLSAFCIAVVLAVSIPVAEIRLNLLPDTNEPLVCYAALRVRLENLGGPIVLKDSYDDTIKEAKRKQKELEEKKKKVEAETAKIKKEYDSLSKYVEELDLKQNDIALSLAEINNEIRQTELELEEVRIQLSAAEERVRIQYNSMKGRIKYIYENGELGVLDAMFSSKGLADVLNQLEYVEKITAYDKTMFDRFLAASNEVRDYKVFLEAKSESLELSKHMFEEDQKYADALLEAKNKALSDYAKKMNTNVQLVSQYLNQIEKEGMTIEQAEKKQAEELAAEKKRQEEYAKQQAALGNSTSHTNVSTGYSHVDSIPKSDSTSLAKAIWPFPGHGTVGSHFGPRKPPTAGASSFHKGIDIGGNTGDAIVATLAGRVMEASYNNSGGFHVYIDHGNGVISRYLHCSKLLVSSGDYVKQGQVIGLCGSTGIATGPHLHFCIYINGTPVDPENYVKY